MSGKKVTATLRANILFLLGFIMVAATSGVAPAFGQPAITDARGEILELAEPPGHVICSGAGCLRLLVYLQAQDRVVAVDSMERREISPDPRPYALAKPGLKKHPLFGEFRGRDNPELIVALEPAPQLIFKTFAGMGTDPAELQEKTGIPVIPLKSGNLGNYRDDLYRSLRLMGAVLGKAGRAEEVIAFFEQTIRDLESRTAGLEERTGVSCYVGGIAFKGPRGFQSTEPRYPPFRLVRAGNVAFDPARDYGPLSQVRVDKEKILLWEPDFLFLDLASTVSSPGFDALKELEMDPVYRSLGAVRTGRVYGLMPYNWYGRNFGAVLANAYYVGSLLYPKRFADIDPVEKADRIFGFLVGEGVYARIDAAFGGLVFAPVLK